MVNAIILAGSEMKREGGRLANKALLTLNGRHMVDYVIEALKKSGYVDKIIVTGSAGELRILQDRGVDAVIDCNGTIMQSLLQGAGSLNADKKLLVCSCDIPFITSEAVRDFIEKAMETKADICYPVVEKNKNEEKFPGVRRTYVRIKDGTFTGGNIFYIDPKVLEKGIGLAEKLLEARKNPFKMAGILGLGFLTQFLTGTLTLEKIEKKFSALIQLKGKAIITQYPEIGNDIDRPEDIAFAQAYFSAKA